jgi:GNAT superfamily N-acetyltransferase
MRGIGCCQSPQRLKPILRQSQRRAEAPLHPKATAGSQEQAPARKSNGTAGKSKRPARKGNRPRFANPLLLLKKSAQFWAHGPFQLYRKGTTAAIRIMKKMPAHVVKNPLVLRPATIADVPLILELIRGLAEYEREPQAAVATAEDLIRDGFSGGAPKFWVVIAEWGDQPAGFAFYFYIYSTWQGQPGLYLEDLFVKPEFRGKKIGLALLVHLAQTAVRENCYGMRWQVLDWNEPAIKFYESLGGQFLDEWRTVRLAGDDLRKLAEKKF